MWIVELKLSVKDKERAVELLKILNDNILGFEVYEEVGETLE